LKHPQRKRRRIGSIPAAKHGLKNVGKNAILDPRKRLDETPVAGNALEISGWTVRESSCGKVRAFESSRARQLLCAEGVPGAPRISLVFVSIFIWSRAVFCLTAQNYERIRGNVRGEPRTNRLGTKWTATLVAPRRLPEWLAVVLVCITGSFLAEPAGRVKLGPRV